MVESEGSWFKIVHVQHTPEAEILSSALWTFDTEELAVRFKGVIEGLSPGEHFEVYPYRVPMHNPTLAFLDRGGRLKVVKVEG